MEQKWLDDQLQSLKEFLTSLPLNSEFINERLQRMDGNPWIGHFSHQRFLDDWINEITENSSGVHDFSGFVNIGLTEEAAMRLYESLDEQKRTNVATDPIAARRIVWDFLTNKQKLDEINKSKKFEKIKEMLDAYDLNEATSEYPLYFSCYCLVKELKALLKN